MSPSELTNEKSEYLIDLPKKIIEKGKHLDRKSLHIVNANDYNFKFQLVSESDSDWNFMLEVSKSRKTDIKINLHFKENKSHEGLLRIDFSPTSYHENPQSINKFVPDFLKPYCGVEIDESHIHYHVQGYKQLAWAIPLTSSDFSVKKISNFKNFCEAFREFSKAVSLKTFIEFEQGDLL